MSLFNIIETACPACGATVSCDIVHSVNADRRPDLRDAILDGSFQMQSCGACGERFRIEPEFTYLDIAGKQFLSVWPSSRMNDYAALEARSQALFDKYYGPGTSAVAAQIGRELTQRVVFGWEAAREKIFAAQSGIDDVTLELAKIAVLRWTTGASPDEPMDLRLVGFTADNQMVIGLLEPVEEKIQGQFTVPRDLITEIQEQAEAWKPLRDRLTEGSFVDLQRLEIEPLPAAA